MTAETRSPDHVPASSHPALRCCSTLGPQHCLPLTDRREPARRAAAPKLPRGQQSSGSPEEPQIANTWGRLVPDGEGGQQAQERSP